MIRAWWQKLTRCFTNAPIRRGHARRSSAQLWVEALEDRTVPAAPTVLSTTPDIFTDLSTQTAGVKSIKVFYNSTVFNQDAASNYDLRNLGSDGQRGTADDVVIPFTVAKTSTTATLSFATLPASTHRYEFAILDNITNSANERLDGDADGNAGGSFVRAFTIVPAAAKTLVVSGFPSSIAAGTPGEFTVTARDPYGNIASGYTGTVSFSSSDQAASLPTNYTFTASDAGVRSFSATLYTAAPTPRSIAATDVATATITGKQTGISVVAGTASYFTATAPESVVSGTPYEITFVAKDARGNVATGYTGTVSFSSSDPAAELPASYTFTQADAGKRTFTVTLHTPGVRNVVATDTKTPTITGKQSTQIDTGDYLWLPSTNTIYVSKVATTLTDIKARLPGAPLSLVDAANHTWLLDANLILLNGATLKLHGTSIGGDVNQLRLRSNNHKLADGSEDPRNSVVVKAAWGTIDIASTRITSWDAARNAPDTNPGRIPAFGNDPADPSSAANDHVRASISVRSFFAADGVTPLESRMNITDSDIGYLGSHAVEGYGLSWKALGVGAAVHEMLRVYGDVKNSRIHHNFFGIYTYGGFGMQFLNNEIDHNVWYGLDPHDDSNKLRIEGNYFHDNGTHGLILSVRCIDATILNNISANNGLHGIMLHRDSNNALIEGNKVFGNGADGIAIFESFGNTIKNNDIHDNVKGLRFSLGSANNVASNNKIHHNRSTGIDFFRGTDTPNSGNGRPHHNLISNNSIHDNGTYALRVADADSNTFQNNQLFNGNVLLFDRAFDNIVIGNVLPADALIRTTGAAAFASRTLVQNQASFLAQVDGFSTLRLGDAAGTVFLLNSLATSLTSAGSQLLLNKAKIGSSAVRVTSLNMRAAVGSQSASLTPTAWQSVGSPLRSWKTQTVAPDLSLSYTIGDLAPNTTYRITKNGVLLKTVATDAAGVFTFNDTPGTTATVAYAATGPDKPILPLALAQNVAYSSATNTITVAGPVALTLTQLKALLPSAAANALILVDPAKLIWFLRANLRLEKGAALILEGSSIGGDVNYLRLKSENVVNGTINLTADWGYLWINSTKITSWNAPANAVDTEHAQFLRAYILVTSNSPTGQARMDIHNSEIAYLGYSGTNNGLEWDSSSDSAQVFGNVSSSNLHHNYYGGVVNRAGNMIWRNNEIHHNIAAGLDFDTYATNVVIEGNSIHDNGMHGIDIGVRSSYFTIRNNSIRDNAINGIIVDDSDYILVEGNELSGNKHIGVGLFWSDHNTIRANLLKLNAKGIVLQNSKENPIAANDVSQSAVAAVWLSSSDNNGILGNSIHHNAGYGLRISSSKFNKVKWNSFTNNTKVPTILVEASSNNDFSGNSF